MDSEKFICHQCIDDSFVSRFIKDTGNNDSECSYCDDNNVTITLEEIEKMMHEVFVAYYSPREDIYYNTPGISAEEVIVNELGVGGNIAKDIYELLCDENDGYYVIYSEDFVYTKKNVTNYRYDYIWDRIKDSLKTKSRFFNNELHDFLGGIFLGMDSSAIKSIDNNTVLFRARVFEGYDDTGVALEHPERNFAPPPSLLASAGRMNAHGVPVFYGASNSKTAIAEVRPAVGSMVVVAQFRPLRVMRVFDLTALDYLAFEKGSLFDPAIKQRNEVTSFLNSLSRKLTVPISGKNRDSEYLITQAVAEYLSISESLCLDGIMFRSTQSENPEKVNDDYNVVLFSKSSKVKNSEENKVRYNVSMMENPEDNIWIFDPSITPEKSYETILHHNYGEKIEPTLEVDISSLEVHTVKGISFSTESTTVGFINVERE